MDLRVCSALDDRLIEVRVRRNTERGSGVRIGGLPESRARTTADRIRAALVNSGLMPEAPSVTLQLDPAPPGGSSSDLDLGLALAVLAHTGRIGKGLRWIMANGRLGLDGRVYAEGVEGWTTLADVAGSCQTPSLEYEHMFGVIEHHE